MCGNNGRQVAVASRNFVAWACLVTSPRKRWAHATARGVCPKALLFTKLFPGNSSRRSASLHSSPPLRPLNQPNRRVRTRTHGDVGGEKPKGFPLSQFPDAMSSPILGQSLRSDQPPVGASWRAENPQMWIQAPLTPTCAPGAGIAWPVRPTVHLALLIRRKQWFEFFSCYLLENTPCANDRD